MLDVQSYYAKSLLEQFVSVVELLDMSFTAKYAMTEAFKATLVDMECATVSVDVMEDAITEAITKARTRG